METASLTGIIKTVFWIAIIYYAFRFLVRLILPYAMKKVVEKAATQFQNQQQQAYQQPFNQSQAATNSKPRETKKVGEYVDFEEID